MGIKGAISAGTVRVEGTRDERIVCGSAPIGGTGSGPLPSVQSAVVGNAVPMTLEELYVGLVRALSSGTMPTANGSTALSQVNAGALANALAATLEGATDSDPLIAQARRTLGRSGIGAQVLDEMSRAGVRIAVMSDAEFQAKYRGASGVYEPSRDTIIVPQSTIRDQRKLSLVMLHEGVHWLQDRVGSVSGMARLGGPIANAIAGAGALADDPRGQSLNHEAQAYVLEALAAKELGIFDGGLGTSRDGRTLSFEEVRQRVSSNPLYQ